MWLGSLWNWGLSRYWLPLETMFPCGPNVWWLPLKWWATVAACTWLASLRWTYMLHPASLTTGTDNINLYLKIVVLGSMASQQNRPELPLERCLPLERWSQAMLDPSEIALPVDPARPSLLLAWWINNLIFSLETPNLIGSSWLLDLDSDLSWPPVLQAWTISKFELRWLYPFNNVSWIHSPFMI